MKKFINVLLLLVVFFGVSVSSVLAECERKGKTEYCTGDDGRIKVKQYKTTPEEEAVREQVAEHKAAVQEQVVIQQTAKSIYDYQVKLYNSTQLAAAIQADKDGVDRKTAVAAAIQDEINSGSFGTNYTVVDNSGNTYAYSAVNATFTSSDCKAVGCDGGSLVSECGEEGRWTRSTSSGSSSLCSGNVGKKIWDDFDYALCVSQGVSICSSLASRNVCMPTKTVVSGVACGNGGTLSIDDCGQANCSGSQLVAQGQGAAAAAVAAGCSNFCVYPLCGQDNLCGGSCSNSDGADPAKTPLYPPDGSKFRRVNQNEGNEKVEFELKTVSTPTYKINSVSDIYNRDVLGDSDTKGEISVSWGPVDKATHYQVQLYPFGSDCSDEEAYCTVTEDTSYSFVPLSNKYTLRARAINPTCLPSDWMLDVLNDTGLQAMSSPTPIVGGGVVLGEGDEEGLGDWDEGDFEIEGDISGMVKQDQSFAASLVGGVCTLGGASGIKPGDGSAVIASAVDSYGTTVGEGGDYSLTVPVSEGEYNASLVIGDTDRWRCTCPEGCTYSGIEAPNEGLDFFVSNVRRAWFQVDGGNVHADGGNVSTYIPDTCVGACAPYLITGETGLPSYTGGLSLGSDFDTANINETGSEWRSQTEYKGDSTDYAYFARILSDDPDGFDTWTGVEPTESGVFSGEGVTQTQGGDWSIGGGQKTVLLVPGDLTIENNISVAEGSFLAVISSGNITINDSVTDLSGVFISDGIINSCETSSDVQLIAEGIFVGWSGINLCRDFGDDANNTQAVERFVYRPDLQVNAYNYLLKPQYRWQEVAP
jgi:hypothetical protein